MIDIIRKVRSKRMELGMTQAEVAKSAGVSRATVNRFETGNFNNISFSSVIQIMMALGLELKIEEPQSLLLNEKYQRIKSRGMSCPMP